MRKSVSRFTGNGADAVQAVIRIAALPSDPLAAAGRFYEQDLPQVESAFGNGVKAVAIIFPSLGKVHRGWMREAVAALARAMAPVRVNAVIAHESSATDTLVAWLGSASGVTGQIFVVDGQQGEIES